MNRAAGVLFSVLVLVGLAGVACTGDSESIYENKGDVCIGLEGTFVDDGFSGRFVSGSVGPDAPLDVSISLGCFSSGCEGLDEAGCSAVVDGNTIRLNSFFRVALSGETACPSDCNTFTTTCEIPPLDEGEYTLVYGNETRALTVPADAFECFSIPK